MDAKKVWLQSMVSFYEKLLLSFYDTKINCTKLHLPATGENI